MQLLTVRGRYQLSLPLPIPIFCGFKTGSAAPYETENQLISQLDTGPMRLSVRIAAVLLISLAALWLRVSSPAGAVASTGYDWRQFDSGTLHNGDNTLETTLAVNNVGSLRKHYSIALPDAGDGAPAYLRSVRTRQGVRNLLFVTGKGGHILAIDARNGKRIWQHDFGNKRCFTDRATTPCYETSSPAIDPNRRFVYTYGLDGRVHKLAAGTGKEVRGHGWPEVATRKPFFEKGSSALSIATDRSGQSFLYVTNGGYPIQGELGDYQGHITTINLRTGQQHVFNADCSNRVNVHFATRLQGPDCVQTQAAVWSRIGAVYDPHTNLVYFSTGNGSFDPAHHNWGDSVLALHPDGTGNNGQPVDSYTPTTYPSLQSTDSDLGSTAPTILPTPAGSRIKDLAVQGGKDAMLRLIDLDNLSGRGGPGHVGGELQVIPVPQGKPVFSQPAAWVNPADGSTWVFVTTATGVSGLRLKIDSHGNPTLEVQWVRHGAGTSPLVANNVLYVARSHLIQALNPSNGSPLWSSQALGGIHWQSPVVADGAVYILDNNRHLTAFSRG